MDFVLKLGSKIADEEMSMGTLDTYNDRVIAFEAVKTSELPSRMVAERQPLQPSNHQVLQTPLMPKKESPPFSGSKALYVPTRQSPLAKGRWQNENAVLAPQVNPHLPAQYQDIKFNVRNPLNHDRIQSPRASLRSPSATTAPSLAALEARSPDSSLKNILPSVHQTLRTPGSLSSSASGNVFDNNVETQREAKRFSTLHDARAAVEARVRDSEKSGIGASSPRPDFNFKEGLPIKDDPDYSNEAELPKQQFFQLHALLKDASPEMLEMGVEQGVKLLENLTTPMLDKVEDSPDAAQWVQQIGRSQSQMLARDF